MQAEEFIQSFLKKLDQLIDERNEYYGEYLSFKEACRYLKVSESMLYKLTAGLRIPFSRPNGKLMYFKRDDLNSWMSKGREDAIW